MSKMTEKKNSMDIECSSIVNDENEGLTINRRPDLSRINQTPDVKGLKTIMNCPLTDEEIIELNSLRESEKELDEELAKLKAELNAGTSTKDTMDTLHEYNDIKDAAQVILGAIATIQGVTIASLHKQFDLPSD